MATQNRIHACLRKPLPHMHAHEDLSISLDGVPNVLKMSFRRTIRVPDNTELHDLPPDLGKFPIYNINHYKDNLPQGMTAKGGCFMPIYEYEAMWVRLKSTRPFAVQVHVGGINAISGEPLTESFASAMRRNKLLQEHKTIQDYAVIGPADENQLWLDGIAKVDGKVMQFVAVPLGTGYTVEAQISGSEGVGGVQISVTPVKTSNPMTLQINQLRGRPLYITTHSNATVYELMTKIFEQTGTPVAQQGLLFNNRRLENKHLLSHYGITEYSILNLILSLQGGGLILYNKNPNNAEMGVAAGGLIKQSILRDPHAPTAWDSSNTTMITVQLLNATVFQHVTGMPPPPSPVTAETYATYHLPFFRLPPEPSSGIFGRGFAEVQSISELERENGRRGLERELAFPVVQLDRRGRNTNAFRPVQMMEEDARKWDIAYF